MLNPDLKMDMAKKTFPDKLGFSAEGLLESPPAVVKSIKILGSEDIGAKPRAFSFKNIKAARSAFPQILFRTKDGGVKIKTLILGGMKNTSKRMINADGNELWFVHSGSGCCYTSFGKLGFAGGDYIFIPRSVLYKIELDTPDKGLLLGIESWLDFRRPNFGGLLNRDIPYAPEKIEKPITCNNWNDAPDNAEEWEVYVKRLGRWGTVAVYPFTPFSRISWQGELFPFVLHASDINTIVSPTTHIDPSAFATFITDDKSVCISTFRPRWIHSLPYSHINHYDEILFYAAKYAARGGMLGPGDATFHPQGLWHGPQIEALENWAETLRPQDSPWAEELAIMFESQKPLIICKVAFDVEITNYWQSWYLGWKKGSAK